MRSRWISLVPPPMRCSIESKQTLAEVPVHRGIRFGRHELAGGAEDLCADSPELERELGMEQLRERCLGGRQRSLRLELGDAVAERAPDLDLFDEPSEGKSVDRVPERVVVERLHVSDTSR